MFAHLKVTRRILVLAASLIAAIGIGVGGAASATAATQADSAYPYAPGGVTFNGEGSAVETFSIPAGTYSLNLQVSYDPLNDPDGTGECLFGGELDYVSGSGSILLGHPAIPVTEWSGIYGPPSAGRYPAGDYRLYIYPETTCSWTVELWGGTGGEILVGP
jgi:hypothetical protein